MIFAETRPAPIHQEQPPATPAANQPHETKEKEEKKKHNSETKPNRSPAPALAPLVTY
jgi:hypothetical protein